MANIAALTAIVVLAVAVLVQQLALPHPLPSLREAGEFLFSCLATQCVGFGLPAAYYRLTMPGFKEQSWTYRLLSSATVGAVAVYNAQAFDRGGVNSFAPVFSVLAATYILNSGLLSSALLEVPLACLAAAAVWLTLEKGWVSHAAAVATGLATAYSGDFALRRLVAGWPLRLAGMLALGTLGVLFVAKWVWRGIEFFLPVAELWEAYAAVEKYVGAASQERLATKLFVVTFFCQVSLGYLGVAFLRQGQDRKYALVFVGEGRLAARGFARLVVFYWFATAIPYIVQRTVMENVNNFVAGQIQYEMQRAMRIGTFFPKASSGSTDLLLGAVAGSNYTVEGYTDAFSRIISSSCDIVERKLFSLPKLMLLPGMLLNQPWLVISVLPASIVLDMGRAHVVAHLTLRLEALHRQIRLLANRRRKIEEHDTKKEELIRRGAAVTFVEDGWRQLAEKIEGATLRHETLKLVRDFINVLYSQHLLHPGIELVLAWLLEARYIPLGDTWVYTRVVEDAIDLMLTRFRSDAILATLKTHLSQVADLTSRLEETLARGKTTCEVDLAGGSVEIVGLRYARGAVEVRLPKLSLKRGRVYAVTGPNGSGKSSLFGLLASCGRSATVLPEAMKILELSRLTLPSDDVVEITQQLYCPLFVQPLAWILQKRVLEELAPAALEAYEQRVQQLSRDLEFHGSDDGVEGTDAGFTKEELHKEREDWYGALSGGQRGKVEFIRKVFLKEECPSLLLLDEAFAPLDPKSKRLVQTKLKEFCTNSIILAIYHGGASDQCVSSEGFFDETLHFSNGTAELTAVC